MVGNRQEEGDESPRRVPRELSDICERPCVTLADSGRALVTITDNDGDCRRSVDRVLAPPWVLADQLTAAAQRKGRQRVAQENRDPGPVEP
jgi:hypothetical protein